MNKDVVIEALILLVEQGKKREEALDAIIEEQREQIALCQQDDD